MVEENRLKSILPPPEQSVDVGEQIGGTGGEHLPVDQNRAEEVAKQMAVVQYLRVRISPAHMLNSRGDLSLFDLPLLHLSHFHTACT